MTGVIGRRGEDAQIDTQREEHRVSMSHTDWSDAATSQGTPRNEKEALRILP